MKRTLVTTTFLVILGMALAGPPVDVRLVCGEGADAPLVGVASLVEDQLHLALIDGALEACVDGVFGVADDATIFTVNYTLEDGAIADVQVEFGEDPAYVPSLSYAEVPEIAVEGMLGAQRNRAAALERPSQAAEQAREHAGEPPMDATRDAEQARDQDRDADQDHDADQARDQDRDQDREPCEVECDGEAFGGPPADLPAPGTPRRP